MRVRSATVAAIFSAISAATAQADDDPDAFDATIEFSRHHTTNALDGPVALPDWYTTLRGALENTIEHELGQTRISADAQLRRHDTYDIEDDAALSIAAVTTSKPADAIELRGTFSVKFASEGDDLIVGPAVLGLRTDKTIVAAGLQAGFQLSPDTVLVLEGAASQEKAGMTRFEDDLILPARLDPNKNRLQASAALTRKSGSLTYGGSVSAGYLRSGSTDVYGEIVLEDYMARLHGTLAFDDKSSLAAAAGVQVLRAASIDFVEARPVFELAATKQLPGGVTLRGTARTAYDTASADDPLAAWVRRMEVEAAYRANPALQFGIGVFEERRDNIGLATLEVERGYYGEAVWQSQSGVEVLFRIDVTRLKETTSGIGQDTVDMQLALSRKI